MPSSSIGPLLPTPLHLQGTPSGPLSDLTYIAKDNIDIASHPTGNGNPEYADWRGIPTTNAPVIDQLQQAGATLVSKAHMHELAYGLTGVNPHYGTPENALVPGGIPAGSSSGTAVAVARGVADFGLGTDTGGSVRVPAGYAGLYGWRPTHGLLSDRGVVPLGRSFDTVGVMSRAPEVLERVMRVLVEQDEQPQIRRILLPDEIEPWLRADVLKMWRLASQGWTERAFTVTRTDAQLFERARLAQAPLQAREAHEVHRDWLAARQPKLGADVARLLSIASEVTDEQIQAAARERQAIIDEVTELLPGDTVMLVPAAGVTPPQIKDLAGEAGAEFRSSGLRLTNLASLAGLPVITIPRFTSESLPVGLQLIGAKGTDLALLNAAVWLAEL